MKYLLILSCLLFTSVSFVSNSWADAKIMKCKSKKLDTTFIFKLKNKKVFVRNGEWVPLGGDHNHGDRSFKDGAFTWKYSDNTGTYTRIIDFKYLQYFTDNFYKGNLEKYSGNDTIDCTKIE